MHELDDEKVFSKIVTSLERQLGIRGIKQIGAGNEFIILHAELDESPVVIKVPKDRIFSNVNDVFIDSKVLLDQEFALMRYAKTQGIVRIPKPIGDIEAEGFGALIMSFVPSDDSRPDDFKLGSLLASIHDLEAPTFKLSAQEGSEVPELIAKRLHRRWNELDKLTSALPALLSYDAIVKELEPIRSTKSLLHMDFRCANFRMDNGEVVALLDWSNALIGHPALELARVMETGETGPEFLEGYTSIKSIPVVDSQIETILRLDTATMLALVFLSEDPDPMRGPMAVKRVIELVNSLASGACR